MGDAASSRTVSTCYTGVSENAPTIPAQVIKQSILQKRGRSQLYQPWVLRTIVLDSNYCLSYLDGENLKGIFSLKDTTVNLLTPEQANGRQFSFEICNISTSKVSQQNSLVLAAASGAELKSWMAALNFAIRAANHQLTEYISFDVIVHFLISLLNMINVYFHNKYWS